MSGSRSEVLDWIDAGRVAPERQDQVLRAAGITPSPADWRSFLIQLTLWLGTIALASALIFFFAFNWDDLGRFAKFGLVEAAILLALAALWRVGVDSLAGKAMLVALALLTGALLALTGQVYQTGADTYELFAWWAVLILPWALVGRFSPLWLLWLGLVNLAVILYFELAGGGDARLWTLFGLNISAQIAWEAGRRFGLAWMQDDWAPRLIAIGAGIMVTALAFGAVTGEGASRTSELLGGLCYLAWLGASYFWYRRIRLDAFMLAGGLLSMIAVVTVFLADKMIEDGQAGAFLLIGLVVIGMSALGAVWLKSVVREQRG